jgi:hydroxypyruvate isomerase
MASPVKYSVCLEFFFRNVPLPDRVGLVKELGFDAVEIWDWRSRDLDSLRRQVEQCGLRFASLCATHPAVGFTNPSAMGITIKSITEALEAAADLSCEGVIVMAGNLVPDLPRSRQLDSIVTGLKACAPAARSCGVTLLLETLNAQMFPDYFLHNSADLLEIVRRVDDPSVRALFDLYHLGIAEQDLAGTVRRCAGMVGRFHLAGTPDRHEPERGELDYVPILRAVEESSYSGFLSLEYSPTVEDVDSLKGTLSWLRSQHPEPEVHARSGR